VLCVNALTGSWWLLEGGLGAYVLGSILIGAQSMGHEYSHQTLGLLLSHPADRRRMLWTKFAVLAVLLAALAGLAYGVLFADPQSRLAELLSDPALLPLPLALGLFVAPWMTMLGRSALAGGVFTIALPGAIVVVCEAIGAIAYGVASSEVDAFRLAVWPKAVLALCASGAVLGWRTFMRLEATGGTGADIQLTGWRARRRRRVKAATWRILEKEFHLQQLPLVLVALYLATWTTVTAVEYYVPEFRGFPLIAATMLYLVLLSILMGSLASAEERRLGTLEWQILLPRAAWQQWLAKVGAVLALALTFGIGLPMLLVSMDPIGREIRDASDMWRQTSVLVVLLTAVSLYVSSSSASGLLALVLSFLAIGVFAIAPPIAERLADWTLSHPAVHSAGDTAVAPLRRFVGVWPIAEATGLILLGGFVVLSLWFGFQNHRSAERRRSAVVRQAICLAGYLVAGMTVWLGFVSLYYRF
jgi:hypothetical protein